MPHPIAWGPSSSEGPLSSTCSLLLSMSSFYLLPHLWHPQAFFPLDTHSFGELWALWSCRIFEKMDHLIHTWAEYEYYRLAPQFQLSKERLSDLLPHLNLIKQNEDTVLSYVVPDQFSSFLHFYSYYFPDDKDWNSVSWSFLHTHLSDLLFCLPIISHQFSSCRSMMLAGQRAMPGGWISFEIRFWWLGNKTKCARLSIRLQL